eukprot:TRINITY_DN2071_c0_g2_i9.p1 TRINITY_DN2071_c0_g2~~TRINITY_DN2071_c0_g2_i9.p1  ORF type:complete len:242 (-),score=19.64 TRINITY_DN2071_c0_g2_i9:118-843(-)
MELVEESLPAKHGKLRSSLRFLAAAVYWKIAWINVKRTPGSNYFDISYSSAELLSLRKRVLLCIYHTVESTGLLSYISYSPILARLITLYSWLSLMLFHWKGKYVNWFYRILKLKAKYTSNIYASPIAVDVEEIDRIFVWKEFYHSAISLLEIMQFHQIVNTFESIFGTPSDSIELEFGREGSCALCGADTATMPVKDALKKCDHSFCYYCAQAKIMGEGTLVCRVCNTQVKETISASVIK